MCSVGTTDDAERKPDIVVLGELAMAAGLAGQSVTLCYGEFPAHLLSELWSRHLSAFGPNQIRHIYNQADVRKFQEEPLDVRLVLIHNPRLHVAVGWILQLLENMGGTAPVAFSRSVPADIEGDPGATLVVRCTDDLVDDVVRWHRRREDRAAEFGVRCDNTEGLLDELDQLLGRACDVDSTRCQEAANRLRDQKLLRGLIAGAYLLRPAREDDGPTHSSADVLEGYGQVRELLCRLTATTPDHPLEQLAVDMVNRSNVYLGIKFGDDQSNRNPFRPENLAYWLDRTDDRPPREPITRREVADLGNVGSGTVQQLIEYLKGAPDGYDRFLEMGLARGRPAPDSWRRWPASALAALLRSWSYKQVRVHLQRLQKAGLITAERRRENGPWCYQLPEELTHGRGRFDYLLSADELRSLAATP